MTASQVRTFSVQSHHEHHGRLISAGEKYGRASIYYQTAERMQNRHFAQRMDCYRKAQSGVKTSVGTPVALVS
jgi:hypothetical protein